MKKKIITFILLIVAVFMCFTTINTKADSGWDTDFDTGGWDSDWDSDWDTGWSSSSGGSYGESNPEVVIIIFIIIVVVLVLASKKRKNNNVQTYEIHENYMDAPQEQLDLIGLDPETFKTLTFEIYKNVQYAWMNFNYDTLREYLTDELYNTYMMQLDALKLKEEKNIMSDIDLLNARIISVTNENGLLNIDVFLKIVMYDYVVDKDNKVVRGNNVHKKEVEYIITIVKSDKKQNAKKVTCPNCGAEIKAVTGGKCEYCGSVVIVNAKDYVMSKKKCINQRER